MRTKGRQWLPRLRMAVTWGDASRQGRGQALCVPGHSSGHWRNEASSPGAQGGGWALPGQEAAPTQCQQGLPHWSAVETAQLLASPAPVIRICPGTPPWAWHCPAACSRVGVGSPSEGHRLVVERHQWDHQPTLGRASQGWCSGTGQEEEPQSSAPGSVPVAQGSPCGTG